MEYGLFHHHGLLLRTGTYTRLAIAQFPVALHSLHWMHHRFKIRISASELWSFRPLLRLIQNRVDHSLKSPWPDIDLALYSIAATQLSLVAVHTIMMTHYSLEEVGYWVGLQRIDNLWVPLIVTY